MAKSPDADCPISTGCKTNAERLGPQPPESLGRLVEAELSAKLETKIGLDFRGSLLMTWPAGRAPSSRW